MSGTSRTNVVPMHQAPAPAAAPAPASNWPMNPIYPIPPTPSWAMSGMPAGCCPPSGMTDLMKCYCDIQAATAFISKVVTDLAQNDPAFQQALVDAIVASGSNIPLIGVTNGVSASAGQVGEYYSVAGVLSWASGAAITNQPLTLGVLQPGDWDCWMWATFSAAAGGGIAVQGASFYLNPLPAGFAADLQAAIYSSGSPEGIVLSTMATQALTSVPSLINASVSVVPLASTSGNITLVFAARRRR